MSNIIIYYSNNVLQIYYTTTLSALDYDSVQKGRYKQTLNTEKSSLKKYNDKQKANLYRNSKPSLKEGLRALFAGAAVEGGVELCQSIRKKCKEK